MKTIKIKEIHIKNFKCYESANFKFNQKTNTIKGITGYGKTTIKDAYLWCLGFDCNFAPKINDVLVKNIDTIVELIIDIDNIEYSFKRINKQKWKFNEEKVCDEFVGNDSKFEVDGESKTATNYKAKIAELFELSNHNYIRLVADMNSFNNDSGTKWTWKERRAFLFGLLDIDNKAKGLINKKSFESIKEELQKGKDEVEIAKIINTETKAISDNQKSIKITIENNNKSIQELSKTDFSFLENELARIEQDLSDIADKQSSEYIATNKKIIELKNSIRRNSELIDLYNKDAERYKQECEAVFKEGIADKCPTCGRKFEKSKIVTLKASFELEKLNKIAELNEKVENCLEKAQNLQGQVSIQEKELSALETEYLPKFKDNSLYTEEVTALKAEYKAIQEQLASKKVIEVLKQNNEKLKTDLKSYLNGQKVVLARKTALKQYVEEKIALANKEISKVFDRINFKFYKYNTANAENEYQPTCECLLDGVAYNNLSQGQRIIADFDTNNGLQKLLGLNVPQIIDNKQDNTFEMNSENQKIELVTCNETNINATFIRDVYSEDDCDKKGE